jgi:hypothetical protein
MVQNAPYNGLLEGARFSFDDVIKQKPFPASCGRLPENRREIHIPLKVLALFTELARIEDLDRHTTADK